MKLTSEELKCFEDIQHLLGKLKADLPQKVSGRELNTYSKLPFKVYSLRAVLAHRIADLVEVSVELFKANKIVPGIILTRAVFETTAMLYFFFNKLKTAIEKKNLDDFDEALMKFLFGGRTKAAPVESYNILTAIDQTDKTFRSYRKAYDDLSEFAHPNWSGVSGAYSKLDRDNAILFLGKGKKEVPLMMALPLLLGSLELFCHYYYKMDQHCSQFNELCTELHKKKTQQAHRADRD